MQESLLIRIFYPFVNVAFINTIIINNDIITASLLSVFAYKNFEKSELN